MTAAAFLSLASVHGPCSCAKCSAHNVWHTSGLQHLVHDPFELEKPHHVLETVVDSGVLFVKLVSFHGAKVSSGAVAEVWFSMLFGVVIMFVSICAAVAIVTVLVIFFVFFAVSMSQVVVIVMVF